MADYQVLQADFRGTLAAVEAAGGAHLIAMSPPYPSAARTCYGSLEWEDYQDLGGAVKSALLPGGHCLMNLSAPVRQLRDGHGTERDPMPWRVALDWYDRVELTMPDDLVFGRRGNPGEYLGRFRRDHEPLFWFRKPGQPLPIYRERLKRKAATPKPRAGKITGTQPAGGLRVQTPPPARRFPDLVDIGSLWDCDTGDADLEAQNHPARWPYRLAADIVACFSDVGDLVCDPFLGGGTTLCAACDGDRRFIGGDLAEEWARKSLELADARYAQMTLAGAE